MLSRQATLSGLFLPPFSITVYIRIEFAPTEAKFSFKSRPHFGTVSSSREAETKPQKFFPFVKMAEKQRGVPIHLKYRNFFKYWDTFNNHIKIF